MNMLQTTVELESVTKVIGVETIDSTQQLARSVAALQEHGTLFLACEQTNACDSTTNKFPAEHGGVYFTLLLKPTKTVSLKKLTHAAQQALADTLKKIFELHVQLTDEGYVWVKQNSTYKKIACLWAEENESGTFLVNALISVNNKIAPSYKKTHVSLKNLIGTDTSKELFLDDVLERFWKEYAFV